MSEKMEHYYEKQFTEFIDESFPLNTEELSKLNTNFRHLRTRKRFRTGDEIISGVEYVSHLGAGKDGHQIKIRINGNLYAVKFYHSTVQKDEVDIINYLLTNSCKGIPKVYVLQENILITEFINGRYPYDWNDSKITDKLKQSLNEASLFIFDDNYKNFILNESGAYYVDFQGLRKLN